MPKRVRFDDAARDALWRGVDQLASAVRITLGPRGRSVVLTHRHAGPTITRDGLAVAQEVELPDPFENIGVQMLREAAQQAGQAAGDGTSTATVLAHAMIGAGMRAVHAGCNPVALNRGLDLAAQEALRALRAIARPVGGHHDLERVARIAAGDRVLGELIAHALERVGRAGVVTVEDGRGTDTTLDVVEGRASRAAWRRPTSSPTPKRWRPRSNIRWSRCSTGRSSRRATSFPRSSTPPACRGRCCCCAASCRTRRWR